MSRVGWWLRLIPAVFGGLVAVLAVFALLGVPILTASYLRFVPDAQPPASEKGSGNGTGPVLVAIGDSYMSGEGADAFYSGTDGPENKCRRAATAYPVLVARKLNAQLTFVACSGAQTINVMDDLGLDGVKSEIQYPKSREGYQIEALRSHPDADLVLVSLGGNDAKFAEVVGLCMGGGRPCQEKASSWYENVQQSLGPRLRAVFAGIHAAAPRARIVAMTYPMPFADNLHSCDALNIDAGEANFLRDFVSRLNLEIKFAAAASQVEVVDLSGALRDGGLCHSPEKAELLHSWSWRKPAHLTFDPVDPLRGSFHPTPQGHAAISGLVLAAIQQGSAAPPEGPDFQPGGSDPPPDVPNLPPSVPDFPPGGPGFPPGPPPVVPPDFTPPVGPFPVSPNPCGIREAQVQEVVEQPGRVAQLYGGLPLSTACYRGYVEEWQETTLDARGEASIRFRGRAPLGLSGFRTVLYQNASGVWTVRVLTPGLSAKPSNLNMLTAWVGSTWWDIPVLVFLSLGALVGWVAVSKRIHSYLTRS